MSYLRIGKSAPGQTGIFQPSDDVPPLPRAALFPLRYRGGNEGGNLTSLGMLILAHCLTWSLLSVALTVFLTVLLDCFTFSMVSLEMRKLAPSSSSEKPYDY